MLIFDFVLRFVVGGFLFGIVGILLFGGVDFVVVVFGWDLG